jgi:hypothetical protein
MSCRVRLPRVAEVLAEAQAIEEEDLHISLIDEE